MLRLIPPLLAPPEMLLLLNVLVLRLTANLALQVSGTAEQAACSA